MSSPETPEFLALRRRGRPLPAVTIDFALPADQLPSRRSPNETPGVPQRTLSGARQAPVLINRDRLRRSNRLSDAAQLRATPSERDAQTSATMKRLLCAAAF